MTAIHRDVLARYLFDHVGTAGLRELRAQLVSEGAAVDVLQPPAHLMQRGWESPAVSDPRARFIADMRTLVRNQQYDLAMAPTFIAQHAAHMFAAVARPDGTVHSEDVEAKLGTGSAKAFQLMLERITLGQPRAESPERRLPDNALSSRLPSPDAEPFVVPPEVTRRTYFRMRTVHPQLFKQLMDSLAARDARRDPARRIGAAWDHPIEVPRPAALEPLRAEAQRTQMFAGYKVLALQHLYASTVSIFDALVEGGLRREDLTVLGKPYSGSDQVAAEILRRGHKLLLPSLRQSEYADNEAYSRSLIREQVQRLLAEDPQGRQPIMVLDDGGQVAQVVRSEFAAEERRFRFVEQTAKGSKLIRGLGLSSVAVDVGLCPIKKTCESPSIAHSILNEIEKTLASLKESGVDVPASVCLLGAGDIGTSVLKALRAKGWDVHVFDPGLDEAKRQQLRNLGAVLHERREEALAFGHVVLGASGSESFHLDDPRYLPKRSVFFNCASANSELNARNLLLLQILNASAIQAVPDLRRGLTLPRYAVAQLDTATIDEDGHLWDMFGGKWVHLGADHKVSQNDRVLHLPEGRDIYVSHSGFVVNLTDEVDPIPARYIGLTRALLFAALMQAAQSSGRGVEDLDATVAQRIADATEAALGNTGESLLTPQF